MLFGQRIQLKLSGCNFLSCTLRNEGSTSQASVEPVRISTTVLSPNLFLLRGALFSDTVLECAHAQRYRKPAINVLIGSIDRSRVV